MRIILFSIIIFFASCTNGSVGGLKPVSKNDGKGKLLEEGMEDSKGQKQGTWVSYSNKNLPTSLTSYIDGKKNGIHLKFNESGSITEKATFVNDKFEGPFFKYNHSRIKEEAKYQNGVLEGERKLYYDNGKLQEEGKWINGKREGDVKWYNEEGNLKLHYEYKGGEKVKEFPVAAPPAEPAQ